MEDLDLRTIIRINLFTTGRTFFCVSEVERIGADELTDGIRIVIDDVRAKAEVAQTKQAFWDEVPEPTEGLLDPRTADAVVDTTLKAVFGVLDIAARTLPAGHELQVIARRVLNRHFREGHKTITALPYVDELASARRLHNEVAAADVAAAMTAMGIAPHIPLLAEQLDAYERSLRARPAGGITWDEVKRAHSAMNAEIAELVVQILAATRGQPERRTAWMAPLLRQHQEISQAWSAKRKVKDVDPKTGVELPDEPESPVEPAEPAEPTPV